MMILNFNQTEKPAEFEKFKEINYPTFFFGFIIRNEYDQKRLKIKEEYNPKYIFHRYGKNNNEMMFLYGLTENVSQETMPSIYPLRENSSLNKEQYEAVLNQLDVECNDCYLFLNKNLYPINCFYAHRFFNTKQFRDLRSFSDMLERNPDLAPYHSISSFHLFLLTNY